MQRAIALLDMQGDIDLMSQIKTSEVKAK